jgi:hypothetical protein
MNNRRDFIKKIGLIGVAAYVAPQIFVGCKKSDTSIPVNKRLSTLPPIKADVLVVGAGASGIPAAIAAARQGVRVVLLEQDMNPGGAPVNMYVSMLCGGPRLGIYREMCKKLDAQYTITGSPKPDFGVDGANGKNHWYLPSSFIMVLNQMIATEKNINFMCGASVNNVMFTTEGGYNKVKGVSFNRYGHTQEAYASVIIDATGTGLIGELSGAPVMYGRDGRDTFGEAIGNLEKDNKVQRCTWMYISQRLSPDAMLPLDKLKSKGMIEDDLNRWVKPGDESRKSGIYLHWGATVECKDTRDPIALGDAQRKCLETLIPDSEVLLKAGFMMHLAPKMGVREVRRIHGEYVITTNDMRDGNYPEDTIAYTSYGLDPWGEDISEEDRKTKPHGIPFRSLIPLNVEGLLMAGKAISGTHLAASGYRVQPIVASIGQAAGTAAALAVKSKTSIREIDVKVLQANLVEQGLFDKKVE